MDILKGRKAGGPNLLNMEGIFNDRFRNDCILNCSDKGCYGHGENDGGS